MNTWTHDSIESAHLASTFAMIYPFSISTAYKNYLAIYCAQPPNHPHNKTRSKTASLQIQMEIRCQLSSGSQCLFRVTLCVCVCVCAAQHQKWAKPKPLATWRRTRSASARLKTRATFALSATKNALCQLQLRLYFCCQTVVVVAELPRQTSISF